VLLSQDFWASARQLSVDPRVSSAELSTASQPRFREVVPILGALVDRLDDPSSHITQGPNAVPDDVVNDVNAVESTVSRVRIEPTTSRL
jgi:hypothetical protein